MGLPPGATTDDTAMARNLVRSLIERGGLDTDDVLARHIAWLGTRPPDVGNLTRIVLSRAAEGAADAAREYVEQRGPEVSAGNGSVMYCAPLGVAYAFRPDDLFELAPALSAVTHGTSAVAPPASRSRSPSPRWSAANRATGRWSPP